MALQGEECRFERFCDTRQRTRYGLGLTRRKNVSERLAGHREIKRDHAVHGDDSDIVHGEMYAVGV